MIEVLQDKLEEIHAKMSHPEEWDSLIINRRKPYTYRAFTQLGDYRVCVHKFYPCKDEDAFGHPHPWSAAFLILSGSYIQTIGESNDIYPGCTWLYREILKPGTMYEITSRYTWHKVQPLEATYTIMINDKPWEDPHPEVRTTKGKDLEKMNDAALGYHLAAAHDYLIELYYP